MKKTILLWLLGFPLLLLAQDESIKKLQKETDRSIKKDETDTIPKTWRTGGLYGITVAQGTLNNWAAGGENFSLSVNSLLSLYAFYKNGRHNWDNTFDFNLGYIKTTSLGGRKNDDRFDLLSKYGYALKPRLSVGAIFNLRSQIFRGYRFTDSSKILSSAFMSPGYVLIGVGVDYHATKNLSIFVSPLTARWIIVRNTTLSNQGLYGVKPGEKSSFEVGAFATINYLKEFNKNITYKGRMDLFSNYRHKPQNVDLFMSNVLNAKISKALAVTYSLDLIYDDDARLFGKNGHSAALQLKSLLGIGFLVKF